jgi:hypothetical protein
MKEKLFPGGENKFTATIHALQHLVLKLHLRLAPFARFHGTPAAIRKLRWHEEKTGLSVSPLESPLDSALHAPEGAWVPQRSLMPEKRYDYE